MDTNNNAQNPAPTKTSEVADLGALVNIIVDYYIFKRNEAQPDEEAESWKKKDTEFVVPKKIDELIEATFESQLKRFT